MITILGWGMVAAVGVVAIFNASYMLLSPRAWFRLPSWLRANGSLTADRYSSGSGAIQVRMTGAILLAAVGWMIWDVIANDR